MFTIAELVFVFCFFLSRHRGVLFVLFCMPVCVLRKSLVPRTLSFSDNNAPQKNEVSYFISHLSPQHLALHFYFGFPNICTHSGAVVL
jgi:hypothetical protein